MLGMAGDLDDGPSGVMLHHVVPMAQAGQIPPCAQPSPQDRTNGRDLIHGRDWAERRQLGHGIGLLCVPKECVFDRHSWTAHSQLRIAIVTWDEQTYPPTLTTAPPRTFVPIKFETITNTTITLTE
jgi:hypothetical protein